MKTFIATIVTGLLLTGSAKADELVPADNWGLDLVMYGGKAFNTRYENRPFEYMLGAEAGLYFRLSKKVEFNIHLGTETKLDTPYYNFNRVTLGLEALLKIPCLNRSYLTVSFQGPLNTARGFGFFVGFDFATLLGHNFQVHTGFGGGRYFTQPENHGLGFMKGRLQLSGARLGK